MASISTRSAIAEDLSTLLEFEQGIVTAERPFDPTLKEGHINYYDLKALIESTAAEVIVAEMDNQPIGSGYIQIVHSKPYKKHDRHGYIGFMFVKPEHRGKGVAQLVTQSLFDWAKSQGISEVKLEVYDANEPAVKAYSKAGFSKNLVEMRIEI